MFAPPSYVLSPASDGLKDRELSRRRGRRLCAPRNLAEALEAVEAGRAEVEVGLEARGLGGGERLAPSRQLCFGHTAQTREGVGEVLRVEVGDHVGVARRAAVAREVAAEREPAAVVYVAARPCERRA